ncbi:MAG: acVLRF1 family peptidyl-tRNA hydrolase [Jiangellaceae bacterium]
MAFDAAALPPTRRVEVPPERLSRWLAGFADRHGPTSWKVGSDLVVVSAADSAVAMCAVPFPPLAADTAQPYGGLIDHALAPRRVGVVLVRLGGYAAGVFEGRRLVVSKVGSRLVHARSAAGGQSQQRFARRREKQAREALEAAADVVARVVLPLASRLDAVVLGGDKSAVATVLADRRLAPLRDLVSGPHLTVPDPKLAVLQSTPDRFRAVQIELSEPDRS